MGGSDKLTPSGPDRYRFTEQRDFLFALWEELGLGDRVVLVLHDWGSALGFDWANQHRDRVQGIAYMEALVTPLQWSDVPPEIRPAFQGFRSAAGEELVLEKNVFVENVLPGSVLRELSEEEMDHYWSRLSSGGAGGTKGVSQARTARSALGQLGCSAAWLGSAPPLSGVVGDGFRGRGGGVACGRLVEPGVPAERERAVDQRLVAADRGREVDLEVGPDRATRPP